MIPFLSNVDSRQICGHKKWFGDCTQMCWGTGGAGIVGVASGQSMIGPP